MLCGWCGKGFRPRTTGGKPQTFCREACRRTFDAAGRRWIAAAVAEGSLTVAALKNAPNARRPLLPRAVSPTADVTPAESPDEAAKLLHALLAVPSDGWHSLAAAMPEVLFHRLKRWHADYLAEDHLSARRS